MILRKTKKEVIFMEKDLVREFMEETKKKDSHSIAGTNILVIKGNKIYRNVTDLRGDLFGFPGFISFICDGIQYMTNTEIIIRETA